MFTPHHMHKHWSVNGHHVPFHFILYFLLHSWNLEESGWVCKHFPWSELETKALRELHRRCCTIEAARCSSRSPSRRGQLFTKESKFLPPLSFKSLIILLLYRNFAVKLCLIQDLLKVACLVHFFPFSQDSPSSPKSPERSPSQNRLTPKTVPWLLQWYFGIFWEQNWSLERQRYLEDFGQSEELEDAWKYLSRRTLMFNQCHPWNHLRVMICWLNMQQDYARLFIFDYPKFRKLQLSVISLYSK